MKRGSFLWSGFLFAIIALPASANNPLSLSLSDSAECALNLEAIENLTTPDKYWVRDRASPGLRAEAEIDDEGILHIEIKTRMRNGQRSSVLFGKAQWASIMKHFAGRFVAIQGTWVFGDNLNAVNQATGKSNPLPLEQAVLATWTAERAREYGWTRARVLETEGEPGDYQSVIVRFER